ncbi:ferrous iron transport protein B [uncultured Corynebacterium sp.]|uniref:ferrous iron transport protein B n=1 Tax=uncultured Corynebacterium sp. TaxID=159447 RepID=UPI0025F0BAFF|nr:ferrous iron transport protein B [uncultured Corynebacterium sp.]
MTDATAVPNCHACAGGSPAPAGAPVIGLVGAPNSGKSTLFNALTGARARTGNWPGTTVEISRGAWKSGDVAYDVIDFPGAYSLDPMSPDEELTREMLVGRPVDERPDLVIVAVDATATARGLYLFSEIAEHPYRVVVVLTKVDVAAAQGLDVDAAAMEDVLGVPVVAVDPRRRSGVEAVGAAVAGAMTGRPRAVRRGPEGTDDADAADARFAFIDRVVAAATVDHGARTTVSDRIDRVALHRVAGPLLFLAVMWSVFQITTVVAAPLQDGLEGLVTGPVSDWVRTGMEAVGLGGPVAGGLVVDGLVGGVGMVLTFAPLMALMFLCLAVLEDSGYMARAAVVTDRVMRAIGLPGKAFIPLIVGFGCNVPAISATRVLGDPRHRILTALLIPFTSCSARLTVYVMLAAVFFPGSAGSVVLGMYLISIGLVVVTGLVLRRTLWRAMPSEPLVIDLPAYQFPMPRLTASVAWTRLRGFLRTAGGIIVVTVVVVWTLMSVPAVPGHSIADEDLAPRDSVYGAVSETVAPVFVPAGFGSWSLTGTLLTGFVAKEAVISTWAQTYAVDDVSDAETGEQASSPLADHIRADFNRTSGGHGLAAVWAFMIFLLAYTPCVATLAAQKREIGLKWTLFGLATQLAGAWALAVAVFQILRLFT